MYELTKKEKLKVANEVFGWWRNYAQQARCQKEHVVPFGIWLLQVDGNLDKEAK